MPDDNLKNTQERKRYKPGIVRTLRNRLFTGIIVALPIVATFWAITTFVQFFDQQLIRVLPVQWNPSTYLGFDIPGLGLIVAILLLIILGTLASNFIGNEVLKGVERLLSRVPVVSNIYNFLKQIVTTVAQQSDRTFKEVCLLEYPRKGVFAIGFVTADLAGSPAKHLKDGYICVFVPTTPNPTSGFLLFLKRDDITVLDMTPEEGAKMIISGGMVSSNDEPVIVDGKSSKSRKKPNPQPSL